MARSAPSETQTRHFSSLPAVVKTVAPNARASWIAVVPMPLVPPCTRKRSPAARCPSWKTFAQTVKKVFRDARRLFHGKALWHRQALWAGRQAILGVAAAGDERADAVALTPAGVRGRGGDGARDFHSEDGRCSGRGRILAGALHEVGTVDPGGCDADHDFAGSRHGSWAFGEAEDFRWSGLCDLDVLHRFRRFRKTARACRLRRRSRRARVRRLRW